MLNLEESVRSHCPEVDPALVESHFRRMPFSYFERYSPAEIGRHLRLLGGLQGLHAVDIDARPLAAHAFEILVVGTDQPGTVACITGSLAAYGFDLEDVQVSLYMDPEPGPDGTHGEHCFFVIVLRVSGSLHGRALIDWLSELRERLRMAFLHLAKGHLLEAQTIASDTRVNWNDASLTSGEREIIAPPEPPVYEGIILGGDFRIDRKLATGGMSEVFSGTQTSLNRPVAIKVFRHESTTDDESLARFNQEALVLAQFSCAHIVQIYAAGSTLGPAGRALGWMAMEYMPGGDLGQWLQEQGPPSVELALRWLRQALEGLQYAHRRAIWHRDLKPHNLLLTAEGNLKVSDFGLLKRAAQAAVELTTRTPIVGTPNYMSPEQALGETIDERSDIFSLGTTFFHLLSGRLPFQKSTTAAVLLQIAQQDAPKLADVAAHLPLPLSVIVGRMMARRCEERYQEVGVILEDLESYERRGLLGTAATFTASAGGVSSVPDAETQAYEPRPQTEP
jgi:tRNA A-37 threonylcarbamoyl transferase component Bud32